MTGREWKPGDVAMVADEFGGTRVAVHGALNPRMKHRWHYSEQGIGHILADPRPLVVVDTEDREQVERLVNLVDDCFNDVRVDGTGPTAVDLAQTRLREFASPTPPKPDEPTGWLAAVLDDAGDKWVRDGMTGDRNQSGRWWNYTVAAEKNYDGILRADWDAIAAVKVLSPGVEAGEPA